MWPWLSSPANASSRHHFGRAAKNALEQAREQVAAQLDAKPIDAKTPAELLETFAEDYPLVDACLAEALRLWPPGAITIRKAATDDDGKGNTEVLGLSSDGSSATRYLVPKGTWMHCCIWSIHRDAKVWPRAEEFLPERFLSPEANKGGGGGAPLSEGEEDLYAASQEARSHYYFPFGDGALHRVRDVGRAPRAVDILDAGARLRARR